MVLIFAGPKNRENKNTRSLKPRNGEPCEVFDVYSMLEALTLTYIVATPVMPSDAGVAFSIINFATPLTHNPKGGRYSDVLG